MPEQTKVQPIENDDDLLRRIQSAESTISLCKKNIDSAKAELLRRRKDEITQLLKAKDEPYGDVTITVGNHQVKVTTPKKVEWNSEQLAAMAKQMESENVDPRLYMKIEYGVSETVYKQWPTEMKDYFMPARTVKPGTVSIKVAEAKE